jgi:hypothetical protein
MGDGRTRREGRPKVDAARQGFFVGVDGNSVVESLSVISMFRILRVSSSRVCLREPSWTGQSFDGEWCFQVGSMDGCLSKSPSDVVPTHSTHPQSVERERQGPQPERSLDGTSQGEAARHFAVQAVLGLGRGAGPGLEISGPVGGHSAKSIRQGARGTPKQGSAHPTRPPKALGPFSSGV